MSVWEVLCAQQQAAAPTPPDYCSPRFLQTGNREGKKQGSGFLAELQLIYAAQLSARPILGDFIQVVCASQEKLNGQPDDILCIIDGAGAYSKLLASKDTLFIGCNAVAYSVDVRQLYLEDSGLMSI